MTALFTPILLVLHAVTMAQPGPPYSLVVVDDQKELRSAINLRVEGTFTPTQAEAEAPRRDLARYLESQRRREKSKERQKSLRRITLGQERYVWHCGGYKKGGQKYLFCTFVQRAPDERLLRKKFPVIKDGGITVCSCHFDMKNGRIFRLDWNGEA